MNETLAPEANKEKAILVKRKPATIDEFRSYIFEIFFSRELETTIEMEAMTPALRSEANSYLGKYNAFFKRKHMETCLIDRNDILRILSVTNWWEEDKESKTKDIYEKIMAKLSSAYKNSSATWMRKNIEELLKLFREYKELVAPKERQDTGSTLRYIGGGWNPSRFEQ